MVISQAMACGLPIISTENTGGSEIIDNNINGYIIPVKNNEILKEKIKELYQNRKKLKRMGLNAYKKSLSDLSWENYGNKIFNAYESLYRNKI